MTRWLVFVFALFAASSLHAQHQFDNWYFGFHAGITFASGAPQNLPDGAINAWEGCASISDTAGNLLFYTDGVAVMDAQHDTMPNGSGLYGGWSSSQAALIVQDPANSNQYYVFTTAMEGGAHGLCYSKVDMTLDNGLGDVTDKNIPVLTPADERITAIRNTAAGGWWLLAHQQPNSYYAYSVTASGIGAPVVSNVGMVAAGTSGYNKEIGQFKMSPQGNYLANTLPYDCALEISRFDTLTGVVSAPFDYQLPINFHNHIYSAEFSPSGEKLYFGGADYVLYSVYQMNMTAGDSTAMLNSITLIKDMSVMPTEPVDSFLHGGGTLQLAPNHKIYMAHTYSKILSAIDYPELPGLACHFNDTALVMNSSARHGLPNCVVQPPRYDALPTATIQPITTKICPDSCIAFGNASTDASSYEWFFPGANPGYSIQQSPTNICYSTSGTYDVTLVAHNGPYTDTTTITDLIEVYAPPAPTIVQSNDTLFATNVTGSATYEWSFNGNVITGATNAFYIPTQNGTYAVNLFNPQGCSGSDALMVTTVDVGALKKSTFRLFPNPADETVVVGLRNTKSGAITVYNSFGKSVYNASVASSTALNVANFPNGVYLVVVLSGNTVSTEHFVIDHVR